MSQYGALYGRWAPITAETADALPTYGESVSLGALTKVTDAPNFTEVTADGDDRVQDSLSEFTGGTVDINFAAGTPNEAKAKIWGATISDDGELVMGVDDEAPYGGYAFARRMIKGTKKYFQGVFYPKLKATPQGEESNTKLRSGATLTGDNVHMLWEAPMHGKYKYISGELATEEAAKAWVDSKVGAAAAAAASVKENAEGN